MSPRVLIDSSVPLYALGSPGPQRDACRAVLARLADGSLSGLASTEMIQEVVHHRLRMTGDRDRAVADARDVAALVTVVPFDETVLEGALDLIAGTATIRGRDAVHAATALANGLATIVSTDPAFDDVPGLQRLDPAVLTTR
ncbi:MAG: type II toxin-antitoxin system VapC family toxin [Actinomycetia bacterium]|nr:type II toxin-antitoxin system VapC family toxin [Actinomycetes bacterium]